MYDLFNFSTYSVYFSLNLPSLFCSFLTLNFSLILYIKSFKVYLFHSLLSNLIGVLILLFVKSSHACSQWVVSLGFVILHSGRTVSRILPEGIPCELG